MAEMLRGMTGGGPGGGGGGGGDGLAGMLNNPMMMQMAQQMMANGGLERLMGNPAVANMVGHLSPG
jgi:small glutamine-rich tetratricopeptide repeat-containing protein alpha